jgi:hypothetical protein
MPSEALHGQQSENEYNQLHSTAKASLKNKIDPAFTNDSESKCVGSRGATVTCCFIVCCVPLLSLYDPRCSMLGRHQPNSQFRDVGMMHDDVAEQATPID